MSKLDDLLDQYGETHQNPVNKAIHWVCVPLIMWSCLLYTSPSPRDRQKSRMPSSA